MNKSEIAERAAREKFEKWVTAMEPAYADQNLERMTGGRGSYRVHNVHCWWMGWKEGWERAIAESRGPGLRFTFECGCASTFWAETGQLKGGLSCCKLHETKGQTLPNILEKCPMLLVRIGTVVA